ncbi:putative ABC transporter substrate-binding protein [Rhodococcus wratislaviensis NBRC 100605]|uniref:Putative ABC transporter substrate-binding protein n=1 Tax=Rhodococcus wratislaviensis NBRC 100605 TaxID=1219028 RepID=X0Q9D5_RHOWR|nr:putative ABC transporter substrate-binding protein [Rhodococcus wratislaviensis NBRC 100605]
MPTSSSPTAHRRPLKLAANALAGFLTLALAGCGSSTGTSGGAADETVTIGVSTPLTGHLAINNEPAEGLAAYADYINEQGGVEGRRIELKTVDNQGTVAGGASSARTILADNPFAICVLTTPAFTGAQTVLRTAPDTPALVLANGAAIKASDLPNVFGMYTDYTTESFAGIKYLTELGGKKIALVYDPTIVGEAGDAETDYAKSVDAELVSMINVPPTTTNYTPIIQQLKNAGADGVELQVGVQAIAGILKAAKEAGLNAEMMTYSSMLDSSTLAVAGDAAEGLYVTGLFPQLSASTDQLQEFNRVTSGDTHANTALGLIGWNAGMLITAAVKEALKDGGSLTPTSFQEALTSLGGSPGGVLPEIGWTPESHSAIDGGSPDVYTLYQVRNGAFTETQRP